MDAISNDPPKAAPFDAQAPLKPDLSTSSSAPQPPSAGGLPAPLPQQVVDPNTCIILHPGSRNLRLGRPSDSVPYTVLHAIARRHRLLSQAKKRRDPNIVPLAKMSSDKLQEVEDCRLKLSHILQSCLMSDGSRRFATPPKQLAAHNKKTSPCVDETSPKALPLVVDPKEEVITGDRVLNLCPSAPYHIIYPWQRGELNTHSGVCGSITAVMSDLQEIWTRAIEEKLKIPRKEFKNYRCVVVIPDLYNRDHTVHITDLLLNTMQFQACFVFQDHVAATFGSGLGCCCVIDVGDQKTSVSCVEDALSIPSSRLRLGYGGSDICQVLHWLLRKSGFPVALEPATNTADAALLNAIKHSHCHVNLDTCGPQEYKFQVSVPGNHPHTYSLQLADELLVAPLSLCYPSLLQLTGDKTKVLTMPRNTGHPQDPFDDNYLRETTRRGVREAAESMDAAEGGTEEDLTGVEDGPPGARNPQQEAPNFNRLMSLEQALHTSIERCAEDARRRMYSTILVVGAGANFPHLGKWLHNRLAMQIPVQYRPEQVEVVTRAKDLEPGMIAWKGAALMTGLEGSGELWISRESWQRHGVRILREKCPFIW